MGADNSTLQSHNEMFLYLHFKSPVKYVFNKHSKLYASFHTIRHKLKTTTFSNVTTLIYKTESVTLNLFCCT